MVGHVQSTHMWCMELYHSPCDLEQLLHLQALSLENELRVAPTPMVAVGIYLHELIQIGDVGDRVKVFNQYLCLPWARHTLGAPSLSLWARMCQGERHFPLPSQVLLAGLRIKLTGDRFMGEKSNKILIISMKGGTQEN